MEHRRTSLQRSAALAAGATILLVAMVMLSLGSPPAGQEQFEFYSEPGAFAERLQAAGSRLRWILVVDTLFVLAYAGAIAFVCHAFSRRGRSLAIVTAAGILAVLVLDFCENAALIRSLDMVELGEELDTAAVGGHAMISAAKWQFAAATLFSVSFLLPRDTIAETVLAWGARLGLPTSVPLVLFAPKAFHTFGTLILFFSMAGGLALLAWTTWRRARHGQAT